MASGSPGNFLQYSRSLRAHIATRRAAMASACEHLRERAASGGPH
jgi:hypothetical protein